MLQECVSNCPPPNNVYDDAKFEQTFVAMDMNQNGRIEKVEMKAMLKAVAKQ